MTRLNYSLIPLNWNKPAFSFLCLSRDPGPFPCFRDP